MTEPDLGKMSYGMGLIKHGADMTGVPLNSTWDKLCAAFDQPGDLEGMAFIANGWEDRIRGALTEAHNELDGTVKYIGAAWTGSAAMAFSEYAVLVDSAFTALQTACDEIGQAVRSVKTATVVFWGVMFVFIEQTVASLAAFIAALVPSVGVSASGIVTSIFLFLAAVATLVAGLGLFFDKIDDDMSTLKQQVAAQPGLAGGYWPRPSALASGGGEWKVN